MTDDDGKILRPAIKHPAVRDRQRRRRRRVRMQNRLLQRAAATAAGIGPRAEGDQVGTAIQRKDIGFKLQTGIQRKDVRFDRARLHQTATEAAEENQCP